MGELIQKQYAFVLGREVELAKTELEAVLYRFGFCFGEQGDCYLDEEEKLIEGKTRDCSSFYTISLTGNVALINIESTTDFDPGRVIEELGGTVKIFELIGPRSSNLAGQVFETVFAKKAGESKKFNYGISSYVRDLDQRGINKAGLEAKRLFEGTLKSRFVALREGKELSSILSLKNKMVGEGVEVGVFDKQIGILVALSNPEEWSKRDYDKPAGDKKSGMAPPKLARMMVNIALSEAKPKVKTPNPKEIQKNKNQNSEVSALGSRALDFDHCVVVDPFCGSGNILLEAMLFGCDVVGSDVSEKAVNDTRANIEWLIEESQKPRLQSQNKSQIQIPKIKIFQADATKDNLSDIIKCHSERSSDGAKDLSAGERSFSRRLPQDDSGKIVIVTEPYLGEPKKFAPTLKAVQGEYLKIKEIYLAFLKNIKRFSSVISAEAGIQKKEKSVGGFPGHGYRLPEDDKIEMVFCIVFPLVETTERKKYSLYNESVDEIKKLGYTELRTPLVYGRGYQVVKREIVFLKFCNF